jgi:LuxR family maltose regulon positive regulatory protein
MEKYIQATEKMVSFLENAKGGCGYGMDDLCWGELAFFRGQLPQAEEYILKALHKARQKEQYEIENRSIFYLLRVYLNRGEYKKIQGLQEQLAAQLEETGFLNSHVYFDITIGWFFIQTGQIDQLASWLKNDFEASDFNSIIYGLEVLIKARYHYRAREYPAAIAEMESRKGIYSPQNYVMGKIEMKALEAVCRYKMGQKEESFACLDEAWKLAEPNGFIMPFTELHQDMRTLAAAALEWGKTRISKDGLNRIRLAASAYSKRLSFVTKNYFLSAKQRQDGKAEVLSKREKEVLYCLYQGFTGEETAQEINISINTIKSTIKRIYDKLDALNKADALRIAARMGLLKKD